MSVTRRVARVSAAAADTRLHFIQSSRSIASGFIFLVVVVLVVLFCRLFIVHDVYVYVFCMLVFYCAALVA